MGGCIGLLIGLGRPVHFLRIEDLLQPALHIRQRRDVSGVLGQIVQLARIPRRKQVGRVVVVVDVFVVPVPQHVDGMTTGQRMIFAQDRPILVGLIGDVDP